MSKVVNNSFLKVSPYEYVNANHIIKIQLAHTSDSYYLLSPKKGDYGRRVYWLITLTENKQVNVYKFNPASLFVDGSLQDVYNDQNPYFDDVFKFLESKS